MFANGHVAAPDFLIEIGLDDGCIKVAAWKLTSRLTSNQWTLAIQLRSLGE